MVLLCIVLLLGVLDSVILSRITADRMSALFVKHARVDGHDGITSEDYPEIARQLVRFLFSGREADLPGTGETPLFSDRENLHLADCSHILRTMDSFRLFFFGLTALAAVFAAVLHFRGKDRILMDSVPLWTDAFSAASLILFAFVTVLAVWGILDFNGLFIRFHEVFFNNRLWLLDPEKDLLIQLMPEPFFREYAHDILLSLLPVLLLLLILPILNRKYRDHA